MSRRSTRKHGAWRGVHRASCSLVPPMIVSIAMHIDNPHTSIVNTHAFFAFGPRFGLIQSWFGPLRGPLHIFHPTLQSLPPLLTALSGIWKRQPCMRKVCLPFRRPIQLGAFFFFCPFLLSQLLCATRSFRPLLLPSPPCANPSCCTEMLGTASNPPISFHSRRRATIHRPRTADPGPSSKYHDACG